MRDKKIVSFAIVTTLTLSIDTIQADSIKRSIEQNSTNSNASSKIVIEKNNTLSNTSFQTALDQNSTKNNTITKTVVDQNSTKTVASCDIAPVNTLIQKSKISQAYKLSKELYKDCPDSEHRRLYVKLAFWNKRVDFAYKNIDAYKPNEKIYKQIYGAKIIQDLKRGKDPKIPKFLENDYDILALRINREIQKKNFYKAHRLSQRLYALYHTKEALEDEANILFWTKHYHQSLKLFKRLGDKEKVAQIRQILLQERVSKAHTEITKAWRVSQKDQARLIFEHLDPKAKALYKQEYPQSACDVESTRMVGIGFEHRIHSDHAYRDHSNYFEFNLPIKQYTVYGKVQETSRYNKKDSQIYLEVYPPAFGDGYWGYFDLSFTPNADFYSNYSIGGTLYRDVANEEFGFGYEFSHYPKQNSHLIHIEDTHSFSDEWSLHGIAYYEFISNSYAFGIDLDYKKACHKEIKFSYLYSSSNEKLDDNSILQEKGHHFQIDFEYPIVHNITFGGFIFLEKGIGKNRDNQRGVNLFVRKYW